MMQDIKESSLIKDPPIDLNEYVNCYNNILKGILNRHAPVKERVVVLCPHAPWYNEDIERAKQERRQAERRWVKSKLTIDPPLIKKSIRITDPL